jgi:hypothetical protein
MRTAIETQLALVTGIPAPAKWRRENDIGAPSNMRDTWVRVKFMPGTPRIVSGGRAYGLIQIDGVYRVFTCHALNAGTAPGLALQYEIQKAFTEGVTLTAGDAEVKLDGVEPRGSGTDLVEGWYAVMSDIRFHVFTTSPLPA